MKDINPSNPGESAYAAYIIEHNLNDYPAYRSLWISSWNQAIEWCAKQIENKYGTDYRV